jgi:hypothetical protein
MVAGDSQVPELRLTNSNNLEDFLLKGTWSFPTHHTNWQSYTVHCTRTSGSKDVHFDLLLTLQQTHSSIQNVVTSSNILNRVRTNLQPYLLHQLTATSGNVHNFVQGSEKTPTYRTAAVTWQGVQWRFMIK